MNKWKASFFFCLAVLIVSNLFWLYVVFDSGVTQTYQQVTIDDQNEIINALGDLIVEGEKEYNKKDILYLLRKTKPDALIVEEENKIYYEKVQFIFENDRLIEVSNIN